MAPVPFLLRILGFVSKVAGHSVAVRHKYERSASSRLGFWDQPQGASPRFPEEPDASASRLIKPTPILSLEDALGTFSFPLKIPARLARGFSMPPSLGKRFFSRSAQPLPISLASADADRVPSEAQDNPVRQSSAGSGNRMRLWVFRLVAAVLIPAILFAAVELGL